MRRADRLLQIVHILRRNRGPGSGNAIAEELEISLRTLYRDIATLQASGVPVVGEAGVGYVLEEGYDLPPLMFTEQELEIVMLGFPRVRTVRVRAVDADADRLARLGISCSSGVTAHIFASRLRKGEVEAFQPTIFKFERNGFTHVRRGEYVSRQPQIAVSSETIPMNKALDRWNIEACYVEQLESVVRTLTNAGIYFDEQT